MWSNVAKLKAATKPIAPPRPIYVTSTSTSITMSFLDTPDNGGSLISGYKLFRDAGDLKSDVNIQVNSYDGLQKQTTVGSLTSGLKYRFRLVATNEFGDSPESLN